MEKPLLLIRSIAISVCLLFFLLTSFSSEATHFYGGQLKWQQAGGNSIKFTITSTWRRDFPWPAPVGTNPIVGSVINTGSSFNTGSGAPGGIIPMNPTVVSVNLTSNTINTIWEATYTYPTTGNFTTVWNLCCRISTLLNGNNDQPTNFTTIVNVGPPFNNPPVSALPDVVYLSIGQPAATFQIPANDPDGNNLTYRLSTTAESGLVTVAPAGLTISSSGLVTFNTVGKLVTIPPQRFGLQVMIEDGLTKTPVDMTIEMVGVSQPPVFVLPTPLPPNNNLIVSPGNLLSFTVAANDPDGGQSVTLNPFATPIGATHTPLLPVTGAVNGTVTSTFNWTPTASQVGNYVLSYVAVDNLGVQRITSINITVPCALSTSVNTMPATCALNDGAATTTVSNYSSLASLTYTWTGPNSFTAATASISNVPSGSYLLRVNDIATGCLTLTTVNIAGPASCVVLNCVPNTAVNTDLNNCSAVVTGVDPIISPLNSAVNYTLTGATTGIGSGSVSGLTFEKGVTIVTYTSVDEPNKTCTFSITVNDNEVPVITCTPNIVVNNDPNACGAVVNYEGGSNSGHIFSSGTYDLTLREFDISDPSVTITSVPITPSSGDYDNTTGMTQDPTTGITYVIFNDYSPTRPLATLDLQTGNATIIGNTGRNIASIAFTSTGELYGINGNGNGSNANQLLRIDKTTGAVTNIMPVSFSGGHALAYNPDDDKMYHWTNGIMESIDLNTNTITPIPCPTLEFENIMAATFNNAGGFYVSTLSTSFFEVLPDGNATILGFTDHFAKGLFRNGSSSGAGITATDNCSAIITQTAGLPSGSIFPIGITINTFVATDPSGNTATCSFTVTVTDNQIPVINTNGDQLVNTDAGVCGASVILIASATDNCTVGNPNGVRSDNQPLNSIFPVGATTVTWNVSDVNGNAAVAVIQTVIVSDNQAPVINTDGNQIIETDGGKCGAMVILNASASDNCPIGNPTGLRSDAQPLNAIYPIGSTTIIWNITDANGNNAIPVTQTITVIDNEAPIISTNGNQIANTDPGVCGATVEISASTSDNCSVGNPVGVRSDSQPLETIFPIGSTSIIWSVTDANGNIAQEVTQMITVTDNEIPVINTNGDQNVNADAGECGATVLVSASASDNCSVGTPTGVRSDALGLNEVYPIGLTTITWNVSDANSNNAIEVTQTITVIDSENPIISTNGDQIVDAEAGECGAMVMVNASASDNCSVGTPTGVRSDALSLNDVYPVGLTTIAWNVSDANGNDALTVLQTITVIDNQIPLIITNGNQTVNSEAGECGATVIVNASASDNCFVNIPIGVRSDALGLNDTYPVGSTTVTWNVADANGNNAVQVTQTITVIDNQAPTINVSNVSVNNDPNTCGATVSLSATASDNCSVGSPTNNWPGGAFPVGTTNVIWTVTDINGNTGTALQTVTVTDNQAPVISVSNVSVNNDPNTCGAIVALSATASDNCSVGSPTNNWPGGAFPVGTTNVIWTVTDINGNTGTALQTVTVIDNQAPSITCPANTTPVVATSQAGAIITYPSPFASDNCGPVSVISVPASGSVFPIGTTLVTATATDAAGLTSTCSFNVTVSGLAPSIICPSNIIVNNSSGQCGALVSFAATETTGIPASTITYSYASGSFFTPGITTVTATASNALGSSVCTFTVTVNQDPTTVVVYTILAQEEVHMHKNNVVGNVGVWKEGKDAKIHDYSTITGFVKAPMIDLDNNSTISGTQYLAQAPAPSVSSFRYNTMPEPPSDINIPDNYAGIYQLVGTNFKKISVGKNSKAQFMSSGDITVKELITKDADNGKTTEVLFSGNTELLIKKKLEIGKRSNFNQAGGFNVKAYVEIEDVKIGESAKVTASIDTRFNNLLPEDSKELDHTILSGQFIAKKVDSKKWVDWNSVPCNASTPSSNARVMIAENKLDKEVEFSAIVFPNPAKGDFNIKITGKQNEKVSIRVIDVTGKTLVTNSTFTNSITSMGSQLISGTYFAEIIQGNNRKLLKVLKID